MKTYQIRQPNHKEIHPKADPNAEWRLKKAQDTRPLEPILIPKLRIYFADFPYLHYSIN